MYTNIISGTMKGMEAVLIQVEVDASFGLPVFDMVGNMSGEVREARERVRIALKNIGMQIPNLRLTVNLSPARLRKEGTAFDLPIAVGVLVASEGLSMDGLSNTLLIGELGLNGEIKGVKGILPIVRHAREMGLKRVLLPAENAGEGAFIQGIEVYGVAHITEVIDILQGKGKQTPFVLDVEKVFREGAADSSQDFKDIKGQFMAKRAAEIAAAGFHHLYLIGPPGSGKTMIARRLPGIMPPLSIEESMVFRFCQFRIIFDGNAHHIAVGQCAVGLFLRQLILNFHGRYQFLHRLIIGILRFYGNIAIAVKAFFRNAHKILQGYRFRLRRAEYHRQYNGQYRHNANGN